MQHSIITVTLSRKGIFSGVCCFTNLHFLTIYFCTDALFLNESFPENDISFFR